LKEPLYEGLGGIGGGIFAPDENDPRYRDHFRQREIEERRRSSCGSSGGPQMKPLRTSPLSGGGDSRRIKFT